MKSEIIIGLIALAKSKASGIIYAEKQRERPDGHIIKEYGDIIKTLDRQLRDFYKDTETSDDLPSQILKTLQKMSV